MAMHKTTHPLCKKGFLRSSTSGNYTRFTSNEINHWIGRRDGKWQARAYPKGTEAYKSVIYWESPVVDTAVAAFVVGELANWGQ